MKVHGSYTLAVNKNTVTFKAYDAWNYEATIKWGKELSKMVTSMNNEPWACLVDLTEWELATPDSRSYISEFYAWLNEQNLTYLVVVFAHSFQKEILEKTYVILTKVERKYCIDIDEGREWLKSVGF